jgi:uncharacterized protein YvpB
MRPKYVDYLKVPRYYQSRDDNTCGPTCIRMVLDYYHKMEGKPVSDKEFLQIIDVAMKGDKYRSKGTYREEMIQTLKVYNLVPKELSGDRLQRLAQLGMALRNRYPAILSCIGDFGRYGRIGHYVVLIGMAENYVYVNDPYHRNPSEILLSSFLKRGQSLNWDGKRWGVIVKPV